MKPSSSAGCSGPSARAGACPCFLLLSALAPGRARIFFTLPHTSIYLSLLCSSSWNAFSFPSTHPSLPSPPRLPQMPPSSRALDTAAHPEKGFNTEPCSVLILHPQHSTRSFLPGGEMRYFIWFLSFMVLYKMVRNSVGSLCLLIIIISTIVSAIIY